MSRLRRTRWSSKMRRSSWRCPNGCGTDRESAARGHQRRLRAALRLPRCGELPVQGAQGPESRDRREDLRVQVRAAVDARLPPEGVRELPLAPAADLALA